MTCILCRGTEGDRELLRSEVWSDPLWRLTMADSSEVRCFCYLEPKRHIPYVSDLDGDEARTLRVVLSQVTSAMKSVTGAPLVYVYVFGGGIPHLHIHLAAHFEGDALNDRMIRGELEERKLPSGATEFLSKDFPPIPEPELSKTAVLLRERLSRPARREV